LICECRVSYPGGDLSLSSRGMQYHHLSRDYMAYVYDLTTAEVVFSHLLMLFFHSWRHSDRITHALAPRRGAVPVDATAFPPAC
jgi:hypothetical protein